MVNDRDVRVRLILDIRHVANECAHILRRVFVAASQRAVERVDDNQIGSHRLGRVDHL